eukprot:4419919-Amphidinium_carterae.1
MSRQDACHNSTKPKYLRRKTASPKRNPQKFAPTQFAVVGCAPARAPTTAETPTRPPDTGH